MTWTARTPYNELPPLPPGGEIETRAVLKATIAARAALAAMDEAALRVPNPDVLINSITLLEAQASSEIENIVTTTDELFSSTGSEDSASTPEAKETLRYREALFGGLVSIQNRPLSAVTAATICSHIHHRDMSIRTLPGTIIGNPATRKAIYTPPTGAAVIAEKLGEWERFIHGYGDLDPLVMMALAHYQFEAIHPFTDGNGRTGRILNVLLLMGVGVLRFPILFLSRYIITHREEYYHRLQAVTARGEWESWILFMLEAIRETAIQTYQKIDAVTQVQARILEQIKEHTSAGPHADLLAVLCEKPYARIANVIERCGVSRPTATGWLNALSDAGVLRPLRSGREKLYINTELIEILTRTELTPAPQPGRN